MIRRKNRFHGHNSVSRVHGSVIHGKNFSFRFARNKKNDYRLAVVVSKKVSPKAVQRNRIRRRTFETIRTQGRINSMPVDLVVYVKSELVASIEYKEFAEEIADLTKKVLSRLN